MSIPTKQLLQGPAIQSAVDSGQLYHVTLQDGTILWIPKNENNKDCEQVLAWAAAEEIIL